MTNRIGLAMLAALAASIAAMMPAAAQSPTGKVTVLTSFSKDVTDPFKKAYEAANPGTQLEVQNRNTNAGVKFLEETKSANQVDLFWASAPDAFEVLKARKLLAVYKPKAAGIPDKIGSYPINDKDGYYAGFAASGYGIMWNERYVKAKKLPEPKEWQDLGTAPYFDHVSIAAPSRSGTTHLTIEAILQGEGWEKGWRTVKAMSGNFRSVTERSFGVPEAALGVGVEADLDDAGVGGVVAIQLHQGADRGLHPRHLAHGPDVGGGDRGVQDVVDVALGHGEVGVAHRQDPGGRGLEARREGAERHHRHDRDGHRDAREHGPHPARPDVVEDQPDEGHDRDQLALWHQ